LEHFFGILKARTTPARDFSWLDFAHQPVATYISAWLSDHKRVKFFGLGLWSLVSQHGCHYAMTVEELQRDAVNGIGQEWRGEGGFQGVLRRGTQHSCSSCMAPSWFGLVWFRVSGPSLRLVFLADPV